MLGAKAKGGLRMRLCEEEGCDGKYQAKGRCIKHYNEYRHKLIGNVTTAIPTLFSGNKTTDSIYTNGVTKEIKKSGFVKKETERILNDCIKNPKKYLNDE